MGKGQRSTPGAKRNSGCIQSTVMWLVHTGAMCSWHPSSSTVWPFNSVFAWCVTQSPRRQHEVAICFLFFSNHVARMPQNQPDKCFLLRLATVISAVQKPAPTLKDTTFSSTAFCYCNTPGLNDKWSIPTEEHNMTIIVPKGMELKGLLYMHSKGYILSSICPAV